ncbi:MAG TPA: twin-arginine translocation signal domain-containing protein, partial [Candidatus Dormibacteraeota bacterium]|nr:twin-arginine translocation signal domain-containing protein [Candidatus Dormibacteraeota bacterium]
MTLWNRTISRRELLKGAATVGLGAAAAACAPAGVSQPTTTGTGNKSLRILQWSHFIPAYDTWLDGFVKDWGQRNKIAASVDHINNYDLPTRIAAEAAAQAGHDMIEMNAQILTYLYEKDLVDMSDVVEYAEKKLGPVEPIAKKVAYVNGRWLGWVDFYIAIMPIVRTDLVQQYGFSLDKLKTWNDY